MLISRILLKMLLAPIRIFLLFGSAILCLVEGLSSLVAGLIDLAAIIAFITWISQKSYYNAKMVVICFVMVNAVYFCMELFRNWMLKLYGKVVKLQSEC